MKRTRQRGLGGLGLAIAAIAIWACDGFWMGAPADTLPLALGLPLAYFLGRPWRPGNDSLTGHQRILAVLGASVFACGWIIGSLTLLAVSWTLLAMLWVYWGFARQPRRARLSWILLLSFPWLVSEWQAIGWAFRISCAAVTEQVFGFMQLPTHRDGTHIDIMGVSVEIEASCAGWNLLQLTLLAGVAFGTYEIRAARRFSLLLCLLPAIAWFANLLRILILSGIALSFDEPVASGMMHGLIGLAILGAVLAMTQGLCYLLDSPSSTL